MKATTFISVRPQFIPAFGIRHSAFGIRQDCMAESGANMNAVVEARAAGLPRTASNPIAASAAAPAEFLSFCLGLQEMSSVAIGSLNDTLH